MTIRLIDKSHISISYKNTLSISPLFFVLIVLLFSTFTGTAIAGPPFLTDDAEPVDYRHFEAYLFSTIDKTKDDRTVQIPAIEFNWGVLPEVQFHTVIPLVFDSPVGGPNQYGPGDLEVGIIYRFVHETADMPQIGIFPMIELPTGDADRGLGNGRTWVKLPLWFKKSWDTWTTCGGGGYAINHAPDQRNYGFGGWLLQHEICKRLTLGGELFLQGATSTDVRSTAIINLGGYYHVTPNFSILFSSGHSFTGENHVVGYMGLYWTWGPPDSP